MLNLQLFKPLVVDSSLADGRSVTRQLKATYRRTSAAVGGDLNASGSFYAGQAVLESWFEQYLNWHFEESWGGVVTFAGYVHALRMNLGGVTVALSMDNVFNHVRVLYKSSSGGSDAITVAAENTVSQGRFGVRQLVQEAPTYMNSTTAAAYRDRLLAELAEPSPAIENVSLQVGGSARHGIALEIRGYVATLNNVVFKSTSTATDDASDEITAALVGQPVVTAGTIDTNALQVVEEVDYVGGKKRVFDVIELGDGSGNRWVGGCYGGQVLDYYQADLGTVGYELSTRGRHGVVVRDAGGGIVPSALVKPGKMALVTDILAGRPLDSTLNNDPRAFFVEQVEMSQAGVVLKGNGGARGATIALQLLAQDFLS